MASTAEMLQRAQQRRHAGDLLGAAEIYRAALEADCRNVAAWSLLGATSMSMGRWPEAIEQLRAALTLAPPDVALLDNLGIALAESGRHEEATATFEQALKIDADHGATYDHLGTVLGQIGRLDEAVAHFQTACRLMPDNAEAHFKLGVTFEKLGRFAAAAGSFRRALECAPQRADIQRNLGLALAELGRLDEAVAILQQAIVQRPRFPEGLNALGVVLQKQGRLEAAATAFQQAILLKPDYKRAFGNLRNTYRQLGQLDEAVAHCRRTIEWHPANAVAYNSLGTLLLLQDKMEEAKAAFQQAIRLKPNFAAAISNLGHTYRNPGQLDKALNYYRQAMALEPSDPTAHSNLIYVMHFHPGYNLQALAEECSQWRRLHADPLKNVVRPHTNLADPARRLKIGYVSSNFYRQAECFFVAPLLEHHDHERFEIHCYSSVNRPDAITLQLQKAADVWHDVLRMSNETLIETIRADGIDILVDLSMHMGNKRLTMFACKPSPVQVTWLAYPGTTGLDTIDYRLTDAHMEPLGADDSWSSEQPVRLPDCWCCYEPLGEYPAVNPLPAIENGYITFGSLNTPMKFNEPLLQTWAKLLAEVPRSRLLLLGSEGAWQELVRSIFAAAGVEPGRVCFAKPCPWVEYLNLYRQLDIGLDPLPYNGITTTCDALWMGVPVVSLLGHTPAGRAGLGLLRTVGLPELVAATENNFVQIATELAVNRPRLIELRSTLRQRMQGSPLMDGLRFARNVEAAYRTMWRRWCASPA